MLARIERVLAEVRPHPGSAAPLDRVAEELVSGRHYESAAIFLATDAEEKPQPHTVNATLATFSIRTTTRESKMPGLGDIPALGWLFKNHRSQKLQTDLYFFVTPTLL